MAESRELVPSAPGTGRSTPVPGAPAIELDSIGMRFGGVTALAGVSLRVSTGERVAVIGPNGAGKTTLFRVISGERRPTEGTVHLFGIQCTHWSQQRRAQLGLGRTFQVNNVFGDLTVLENLTVAAQSVDRQRFRWWRPVSLRAELRDRVDDALERTGLTDRRERKAAVLSHGEARQLEVALALARDSRILLLDEPAAGLASPERVLMKELIRGLPAETAVVLIEHDMSLALDVVDRVLCLNNGRPVATGSPDEIRDSDEVQRVYLGASL